MLCERLGIYQSTREGCTLRISVDKLIDKLRICVPYIVHIDVGTCKRLVVTDHLVIAEAVSYVSRHCSSRLAESLAEKEETACRPVLVVTHRICETVIGLGCLSVSISVCRELRVLVVTSHTEIDLWLEQE